MTTGEKIQNLRQQKGWSQERLGQELNLSRQSISKWESGTATPTVENLIELAKIFDISVDSLLGNETIIQENKKDKFIKNFPFVLTGIMAVVSIGLIISQINIYKQLKRLENKVGVIPNTVYVSSANNESSLFTNTEIEVQKYYQNRTMDVSISVLPKSNAVGTKVEFSITGISDDPQIITADQNGQLYNTVVNIPWGVTPEINVSVIRPDGTIENETLSAYEINEDLFQVMLEPAFNERGVHIEFRKVYEMDYISGGTENLLSGQPSVMDWKVVQEGKTIKTGSEKFDNYEEYESIERTILDGTIKNLNKNKKFSVTLDITDINGIKTTLTEDIQLY